MFRVFFRPILISVGLAIVVRCVLVQVFAIPSGSMRPTLEPGDQVLVTPYNRPWGSSEPGRGDVVVFRRMDGSPGFFVKRVIGVPGDHLEIRGGQVFVDGYALQEPYLLSEIRHGEMPPEIIPSESFFVMGDHREDSVDSRAWGLVPRTSLVGRARLVFWSARNGDSAHQNARAAEASSAIPAGSERIRWRRLFLPVR